MKVFLAVFASIALVVVTACNSNDSRSGHLNDQADRLISFMEGNWQLTEQDDTSFIYLAKGAGDTLLATYQYRFINGDTLLLQKNCVKRTGSGIVWSLFNKSYVLNLLDSTMISWSEQPNRREGYCSWRKLDSVNGLLQMPGKTIHVRKTLPFSVLLVRKRFDFEHNTSYADSAEVNRRSEK
jgi:hypothetical protein